MATFIRWPGYCLPWRSKTPNRNNLIPCNCRSRSPTGWVRWERPAWIPELALEAQAPASARIWSTEPGHQLDLVGIHGVTCSCGWPDLPLQPRVLNNSRDARRCTGRAASYRCSAHPLTRRQKMVHRSPPDRSTSSTTDGPRPPDGRAFQELRHIAKVVVRAIGVLEVITLLQDRPLLLDAPEGRSRLPGTETDRRSLEHFQIELGMQSARRPNRSGGNLAGPADRNEQRCQFLAIPGLIDRPQDGPFQLAILVFDVLAHSDG